MGFGMWSEVMRSDIYHHRSTMRIHKKELHWCNIVPFDPDKRILHETSPEVVKSGHFFIYQKDWIAHHFHGPCGRGSVSVKLRKDCLSLFNAYYIQKNRLITVEAKRVFETQDTQWIKTFLKKEGVNIIVEEKYLEKVPLTLDATEKIKQLANDVLSGKR